MHLQGIFSHFPLSGACIVFSEPVEGGAQDLAFKLDSDEIIEVLCLKYMIFSAIGTYFQRPRDSQGLNQ